MSYSRFLEFAVTDLLVSNIHRNNDNSHTGLFGLCGTITISTLNVPLPHPLSAQKGVGRGRGRGLLFCPEGPGHSSESLQQGQHLRSQAGKAPKSPACDTGGVGVGGWRGLCTTPPHHHHRAVPPRSGGSSPSTPTVGLGQGPGRSPSRRASVEGRAAAGRSPHSPSPSRSEGASRLERYVGWNLNTGCEVQRKGTEGRGRAEGRARPGPVRSSAFNPFRAAQCLSLHPPLHRFLPAPLPLWPGCEGALGVGRLPAPRRGMAKGQERGTCKATPETHSRGLWDPTAPGEGLRSRPFPCQGSSGCRSGLPRVWKELVERTGGGWGGCLLPTCQRKNHLLGGEDAAEDEHRASREGGSPSQQGELRKSSLTHLRAGRTGSPTPKTSHPPRAQIHQRWSSSLWVRPPRI